MKTDFITSSGVLFISHGERSAFWAGTKGAVACGVEKPAPRSGRSHCIVDISWEGPEPPWRCKHGVPCCESPHLND